MHESLADGPGLDLVREHTVYACVVGSRAFGLAQEGGATERRGVFAAPAPLFWRLDKPPAHVAGPLEDQFSWELERFCALALRGSPEVLECLHSPLVEYADEIGRELLELRGSFLSLRAVESLRGYAHQRSARLETALREHGEPRWNHAVHLVRLLLSCRDLVRTGRLVVEVGEERERLLAVRRGELPWGRVRSWARSLEGEIDEAAGRTPLPAEPDRTAVEDFLVRVRARSAPAAPARRAEVPGGDGSVRPGPASEGAGRPPDWVVAGSWGAPADADRTPQGTRSR
ncbi:nucleotidyltransferase domain-containing protein [Actinacidiphila yeochonensis]|uniref:nucleotidyltransferase domain-containing protein n=1 Tax=Actinacidiphila yeochonensis TaxID=89050 RepID=UPI0007C6CBCA|nr:nucleotidyltransferase domain-containing protein [Actinacidiphila yeochonensis]